MKIERFRHKGLKRLYEKDDVNGLPAHATRKISMMLAALEFSDSLSQIETVPGWKLHPLKGDRKGEYSLTVTGNWRLTFRLLGNTITDLNLEDYH